jgi:hypothetical protein
VIRSEATFQYDISLPFAPSRFSLPRSPLSCGRLAVTASAFAAPLPSCLDMLVKLAAHDRLTVPLPYSKHRGVRAFVALCDRKERALLGKLYRNYYAYLTIDNRLVAPNTTHRNAGWHFDGMQGVRYPVKLPACHQYVVSDCLPTEFVCGSYDATHLDEAQDNWFVALSNQVRPEDERFFPGILEVVLMSAYQLHRSTPSLIAQRRMFMRLDYSLKQQDRLGNSLNPDLPAPWPYVTRDMPAHLSLPIQDTGWAHEQRFGSDSDLLGSSR